MTILKKKDNLFTGAKMTCFHPVTAYRSRHGHSENGKWPLAFNSKDGYQDKEVQIPCGRCIGCRLDRSRQWAIRCLNEASLYPKNCFITITYSDDNVDKNKSLDKRDFVLFMKKLRKKYSIPDPEGDWLAHKIRFFHCGEYGERFLRPHHHACLFNHDFADKLIWKVRDGIPLYRSKQLEELWPYGHSTVGDVTWDSAAYVARYCTKKVYGKEAEAHYAGREPEYVTMSRRPGIGKPWYDQFKDDLYNTDKCVVHGNFICKPAKFYDKVYEKENARQSTLSRNLKGVSNFDLIKYRRQQKAKQNPDNAYERLLTKETIKKLKQKKLTRSYEVVSNETHLFNP